MTHDELELLYEEAAALGLGPYIGGAPPDPQDYSYEPPYIGGGPVGPWDAVQPGWPREQPGGLGPMPAEGPTGPFVSERTDPLSSIDEGRRGRGMEAPLEQDSDRYGVWDGGFMGKRRMAKKYYDMAMVMKYLDMLRADPNYPSNRKGPLTDTPPWRDPLQGLPLRRSPV